MKISSPAFENNELMPEKYTCDGENINPPFIISEVPNTAKSLALICDDPDAPMGTWVHWLVWNISPDTLEIKENSVPKESYEGMTSFGIKGYGGPCPPSGIHRYFFKIYALDIILNIPENYDKSNLLNAMNNHIINQAEIIGLYRRA